MPFIAPLSHWLFGFYFLFIPHLFLLCCSVWLNGLTIELSGDHKSITDAGRIFPINSNQTEKNRHRMAADQQLLLLLFNDQLFAATSNIYFHVNPFVPEIQSTDCLQLIFIICFATQISTLFPIVDSSEYFCHCKSMHRCGCIYYHIWARKQRRGNMTPHSIADLADVKSADIKIWDSVGTGYSQSHFIWRTRLRMTYWYRVIEIVVGSVSMTAFLNFFFLFSHFFFFMTCDVTDRHTDIHFITIYHTFLHPISMGKSQRPTCYLGVTGELPFPTFREGGWGMPVCKQSKGNYAMVKLLNGI